MIVDDEPLAIEVIENHLEKLQDFEVVGSYVDAIEAFTCYEKIEVDLLFIDIEMPDFNGLEFIKALKNKPEVIVTTAFRNFAVQGFDLNILDYLVKPIAFERFMQSVNKFLEKQNNLHVRTKEDAPEYITVRAERKYIKLFFRDILYIEGLKDYVKIVLKEGTILTKQSIGNFEKTLNSNRFFRIHKSFIVALDKVTAYTTHDVEIGQIEIAIGRNYKKKFIELMHSNSFKE